MPEQNERAVVGRARVARHLPARLEEGFDRHSLAVAGLLVGVVGRLRRRGRPTAPTSQLRRRWRGARPEPIGLPACRFPATSRPGTITRNVRRWAPRGKAKKITAAAAPPARRTAPPSAPARRRCPAGMLKAAARMRPDNEEVGACVPRRPRPIRARRWERCGRRLPPDTGPSACPTSARNPLTGQPLRLGRRGARRRVIAQKRAARASVSGHGSDPRLRKPADRLLQRAARGRRKIDGDDDRVVRHLRPCAGHQQQRQAAMAEYAIGGGAEHVLHQARRRWVPMTTRSAFALRASSMSPSRSRPRRAPLDGGGTLGARLGGEIAQHLAGKSLVRAASPAAWRRS